MQVLITILVVMQDVLFVADPIITSLDTVQEDPLLHRVMVRAPDLIITSLVVMQDLKLPVDVTITSLE